MFFFFQAEDGIRDIGVTGVQTCALPILAASRRAERSGNSELHAAEFERWRAPRIQTAGILTGSVAVGFSLGFGIHHPVIGTRSEERRVGKECRSRWSPYH